MVLSTPLGLELKPGMWRKNIERYLELSFLSAPNPVKNDGSNMAFIICCPGLTI